MLISLVPSKSNPKMLASETLIKMLLHGHFEPVKFMMKNVVETFLKQFGFSKFYIDFFINSIIPNITN